MTTHTDAALLARIHADYRTKLAAENAHAETLRAQLPDIVTRAQAARDARIASTFAARWLVAKCRHIAKHQLKLPLEDAA